MSRIGLKPIVIPAGVDFKVDDANTVTVKGPNGTLTQDVNKDITVNVNGSEVTLERPSDDKEHRSLHGLYRALLANMVTGVTDGFKKTLEVKGVGYRVIAKGDELDMTLGYSHHVIMKAPEGIKIECPNANTIIVSGADKQKVGQFAAQIREKRPPEPYKGKGIKYADEHIRRKEGKAGKK
ncbi:MAG: 50S ribosomal protein L6 [Eubacterium sp.]|nr:50S ribosomal protein L6 [Eubacterium sp.]